MTVWAEQHALLYLISGQPGKKQMYHSLHYIRETKSLLSLLTMTVPPCMHILYAYKILPGYFQNPQVSSWGQRLLDLFEFEKKVLETNVHLHSLSQ